MANLHSFKTIPTKKPNRSRFNLGKDALFTLSEGGLFPFYCEEVLPFDTWEIDLGSSIRNLQTQVHPVMDDVYCDFFWFFCPSRLIYKNFEQMMGVAEPSAFTNPTEYELPVCGSHNITVVKGSVANGLGFPVGLNLSVSDIGNDLNVLTLGGYARIWNDWFRDENLQESNPLAEVIYNKASGAAFTNNEAASDWLTSLFSQAAGLSHYSSVNKYKDLFTSCLPSPQKGPAVTIPLGSIAPVISSSVENVGPGDNVGRDSGLLLRYIDSNGFVIDTTDAGYHHLGINAASGGTDGRSNRVLSFSGEDIGTVFGASYYPSNLYADLSKASSATIDLLRKSIAMQTYFERLARGGSRYVELLRSTFGVAPEDATLQRPELVGYQHIRVDQKQVATTAGQGSVADPSKTDTGTLGGYMVSSCYQNQTFKSFNEYGFLYGLAAIRVKHKYWQGIPKKLLKKGRFDFFIPDFDRIGAVPVSKREIVYDGSGNLGFQDAWYEYRHTPDSVSGSIVPDGSSLDLGAWSYADTYPVAPTLSSGFIKEGRSNIDQTLAGISELPQFLVSLDCRIKVTRPMSLDSNPSSLGM